MCVPVYNPMDFLQITKRCYFLIGMQSKSWRCVCEAGHQDGHSLWGLQAFPQICYSLLGWQMYDVSGDFNLKYVFLRGMGLKCASF